MSKAKKVTLISTRKGEQDLKVYILGVRGPGYAAVGGG